MRATPQPDRYLCATYEAVAHMHNALDLRSSRTSTSRSLMIGHFALSTADTSAIIDFILDVEVRHLAQRLGPIGAIDQIADNVDVLADP